MNKLAWLLLPLLIVWVLLGAWYMSTSPCALPSSSETTEHPLPQTPTKAAVWSIADGTFSTSSTEYFTFPLSDFTANVPDNTRASFQSVAQYLKNNPTRLLVLTGRYDATEEHTSSFANLGIARAENIKQQLLELGAPSETILTNGLEETGIQFKENLLFEGVDFAFRGKSAEELTTLAARLQAKPLNVYFGTGKSQIIFDKELRNYLRDLKYYIDNVPTAKIAVTGHTDNTGNRANNVTLGANRAKFIQDYMTRQGFKRSTITTSSKGPDQPMVENSTEEGRAKNRRVEITLEKN